MIHFDEHIFQMGWFNHQLGPIDPITIDPITFGHPVMVGNPPLLPGALAVEGLGVWGSQISSLGCYGTRGAVLKNLRDGELTPFSNHLAHFGRIQVYLPTFI